MQNQEQIDKIQSIMGSNKKRKSVDELSHYTPEEKIQAIYNWKRASSVSFKTDFVDSLYDQFIDRGTLSNNQIAALDRIIQKFNISLDTWSF